MNGNTALKHVSEFLPFMRSVRIRGAAGGEDKVNRFHNIFLGIWDNPLYFIFQFCVFLGEIVVFAEDDLLLRRFIKKFTDGGSKTVQNVHQGGNGRGG